MQVTTRHVHMYDMDHAQEREAFWRLIQHDLGDEEKEG